MAYTPSYQPSAFQRATTENYVSTLDVHQPHISEEFVQRYGSQNLTGLLASLGMMTPVDQSEFSHYEEEFIHQKFTCSAVENATSDTDPVDVTVDAAYVDGGVVFARVNDIVELPNGDLAQVTAKPSANQLTLTPWTTWSDVTAPPEAPFLTSDFLIVTGNAWAEGTDQPEGITPTVRKYTNSVMIMKESYEQTGSEATNKIWFKVTDPNTGKSGYVWTIKGESDTYKRFVNYCEIQMIQGKKATNTAITNAGIAGTEGLLDFVRGGGNQLTYSAGTGFALADFDTMVKNLDKERGSKENHMHVGLDLALEIDSEIGDGFNQGGIVYGMFNGNKEIAISNGFDSFTRGGYTFHKRTYDVFNHQAMNGADGFQYPGMGLVIPGDSQVDPKTRERIPSLRVRYKELGGYSREMEHWFTGSAGLANPTNTTDNLECHYRTERGFEGFAANRYYLIERTA